MRLRVQVARYRLAGMNVIVGVLLAALILGSALIHLWPDIVTLSGGAAAFLGALVGAAAGLGAILSGALYNAHLNRKRDDRLRETEARNLASALAAEISCLGDWVSYAITQIDNFLANPEDAGGTVRTYHLLTLAPPIPTIYSPEANRLIILPGYLLREVVGFYTDIARAAAVIESARETGATAIINDSTLRSLKNLFELARNDHEELIQALSEFHSSSIASQ